MTHFLVPCLLPAVPRQVALLTGRDVSVLRDGSRGARVVKAGAVVREPG